MRLYSGKVDTISTDVIRELINGEDIDVTDRTEAELDVASVLKEYIRQDRELTERAKDILEIRGLGHAYFSKTKRELAEQKKFALGRDAPIWIANQLLEIFMQSSHIEEIYSEDPILRRKLKAILSKHMESEEELDREVRKRIKNLEEGSQTWEVEYSKVMDQMKQKYGMTE